MAGRDEELLNDAFERLEAEAPERVMRIFRRLRGPHARWVRIPVGILCLIAGCFWFLPVIGLYFFPLGLMLIAEDVPFLRRPVARFMHWLADRWIALQLWRAARRERSTRED